jgi:hypothetical protein
MKKTTVFSFALCTAALLMILVRPWCVVLTGMVNSPVGHHAFNAIQRTVKKHDSHEDALEVNETKQSGQFRVIRPRIIPPYQFLAVDIHSVLSAGNQYNAAFAVIPANRYFQPTSLLRI